jgi:DNA-directed RNA polymerase specialized sigma24 family protein
VAEECRRLLGLLDSEELRLIAVSRMEGYSTEEIATRLRCAPRTVERKLQRIRSLWSSENLP